MRNRNNKIEAEDVLLNRALCNADKNASKYPKWTEFPEEVLQCISDEPFVMHVLDNDEISAIDLMKMKDLLKKYPILKDVFSLNEEDRSLEIYSEAMCKIRWDMHPIYGQDDCVKDQKRDLIEKFIVDGIENAISYYNTYIYDGCNGYFTYGNIHKPALLGIFGAILGYSGYMNQTSTYPEYYDKLKDLQISIIPNRRNFKKKIQVFNNSVGYASKQEGGNLIVKEQWLEDPSWTVYVMISNEESEKLADHMIHRRCVYIPYLGKNDHPADIHDISYVEISENKEFGCMINSLSPYDGINFDMSEATFKYEEFLPIRLDSELNQHELQKFILTDAIAEGGQMAVYKAEDKNIVFY